MHLHFGLVCKRGGVMRFVYDAWHLDTTPGAPSQIFSPPQGWDGDDVKYLDWLRIQFKSNHCFRQRLGSAARSLKMHSPVKIDGPFSDTLISALNSLNKQKKSRVI